MARQAIRVKGYSQLMKALATADKQTKRAVRSELRVVGTRLRTDAALRFGSYGSAAAGATSYGGSRASHAVSAEGLRVVVRQRGIAVEQSKRKTTGRHPEYGSAQMRHGLIPAADAQGEFFHRDLEQAFDRIANRFNRK